MRNEYFFSVAGLAFSVALPDGWSPETLLPSFLSFRCEKCPEGESLFRLSVVARPFVADGKHVELLEESFNDMGHLCLLRTADGYRVDIDYGNMEGEAHVMVTDSGWSLATAFLRPEDPFLGLTLSSMLRILYAQAVLERDGVSVHASCVSVKGKSYLFLGKSGTGKSTHARQWMAAFPDCCLLNDDNPIVRIEKDRVMAYGSPWSGKTPCYKNESYPVGGIVRLRQSDTNRFVLLSGPDTFAALLPSCSAIRQDIRLQDALYQTLIRIAEQIPVGQMECLPCRDAAWVCAEGLYAGRGNHDKDIDIE